MGPPGPTRRRTVDQEWMADGNCRFEPPATFFPSDGVGVEVAKRICATCPVREPCLEYALEDVIEYLVQASSVPLEAIRTHHRRATRSSCSSTASTTACGAGRRSGSDGGSCASGAGRWTTTSLNRSAPELHRFRTRRSRVPGSMEPTTSGLPADIGARRSIAAPSARRRWAQEEELSPDGVPDSSSMPFLNSFCAWPSERANFGSWVPPNNRSAITRMIRSSGPPRATARIMDHSVAVVMRRAQADR